jgi:hypothetical protein
MPGFARFKTALLNVTAYCLCACHLFSTTTLVAEENESAKDEPAVKVVTLRDLEFEMPAGKVDEPILVTSEKEFAKTVPDKSARATLGKELDFANTQILVFRWDGSGQDRLTPETVTKNKVTTVSIYYKMGLTRDLRQHLVLLAIPAKAKWEFVKREEN